MAEKVIEGASVGGHKSEKRPRGMNSLTKKWEEKLGIKRTDPNFESHLRDALANESPAKVRSTLMILGLIPLPPRRRLPLGHDEIPDWLRREK